MHLMMGKQEEKQENRQSDDNFILSCINEQK
jgi:hypothetical protein